MAFGLGHEECYLQLSIMWTGNPRYTLFLLLGVALRWVNAMYEYQ